MTTAVLVTDIDDTVRHGRWTLGRFVHHPRDVTVFPEAITMMRAWKATGGRIVGISNQGGVALGHLTLNACIATMRRTQELTGGLFDDLRFCVHHPTAPDPTQRHCFCRKPSPALLYRALDVLTARHPTETYPTDLMLMVGDRPEDREFARNARIDFQWAHHWRARAT